MIWHDSYILLIELKFTNMLEFGYIILTYSGIFFGSVLVLTSSVMLYDINRIKKKNHTATLSNVNS